MAWIITSALEPVYVDDPWDNPNYDPRDDSMDCMMCPCTKAECDKRRTCYWDEVWSTEDDDPRWHVTDYWHDSMEHAGWFSEEHDDITDNLSRMIESLAKPVKAE